MLFSKDFLEEIKTRIPVSEVVSGRVKLRRHGREFIGLSPFNQEKSPSFTVNDQKGFYHCFSSGKHGDIFSFLMETEGLEFNEAVERLAERAGLQVPKPTPEAAREARRRTELTDVMAMAARYFIDQLHAGEGREALEYLERRGLSFETIKRFGLGYAPNSRIALKSHLKAKGVEIGQMIEAGLLIHGEDIAEPYDRFRDRVMFPIQDARGRVIAFGGRALSKDVQAKYLNSPETPLFHKGHVLYNAHRARAAAHDSGSVLVMEGYMDVIAASQAGFAHAVAPLGTALTGDQMQLLWRYSEQPVLCFDGDKAGLKAAYRAVETALPLLQPGKSLRFALLPEGQDPDDLIRNQGRKALEEIIAQARPLFHMLWARETAEGSFEEPEARAALEQRLKALVASIAEPSVRHWYDDALREKLRTAFRPQWQPSQSSRGFNAGGKGRGGRGAPLAKGHSDGLLRSSLIQTRANLSPREAVLVMTVINHPALLESHAEDFAALKLSGRDLEVLRQALFDELALMGDEALSMTERLTARGFAATMENVAGIARKHAANWFMQKDTALVDVEAAWAHMVALHAKRHNLSHELEDAVRRYDETSAEEDFERIRSLRLALDSVEGQETELEHYGVASGRKKSAV